MDSLGQDRMRSLLTNYRRNKIKLAIIAPLFTLLLLWALFLLLRIESIKNRVCEEYAPDIAAAYDEMYAMEAEKQAASDRLSELKDYKTSLETQIEQAQAAAPEE